MTKLDKVISTTKTLINLPHNSFNLDNYYNILNKYYQVNREFTPENLPIKLMSGLHEESGIVFTNPVSSGQKIILIGKGILFDSGGLDLKIGMCDMSNDKAGMIIALGIADYFKKNVVAYCPVTTNFIQNSKIIPGDIIKIGNKKVQINNTDAEGRLILAEAISNLNVSKNDIVITLATLTGCVAYAIGTKATGVFSTNSELVKKYADASFEANELAWALPMFDYMQDYYKKQPIKNSVKDIKAGASEGAMFIKQFVPYQKNWIHLDLAYSAFGKNGKANGVPIKSLINFIRRLL